MRICRFTALAGAACVVTVLTGCAGPQRASDGGVASNGTDAGAGVIKVAYSRAVPNQGTLRQDPTEVTLLTPEHVQARAVGKAALTVLSFVALRGGPINMGYGKETYRGDSLAQPLGKAIANPYPSDFVARLQEAVDRAIGQDEVLRAQSWSRAIQVGDGSARLIYEGLSGAEAQQYRLKSDLVVYKLSERFMRPPLVVDCSTQSDPLSLADWKTDDFARLHGALNDVMAACEAKVLADLPRVLDRPQD